MLKNITFRGAGHRLRSAFVGLALVGWMLPSAAHADWDSQMKTKAYGFIDAYWEKVAETPGGVDADGNTVLESNAAEFDVPNLNLMIQSRLGDRYSAFLNLAAPGASDFQVRNAWVEAGIFGQSLAVRAGKLYRKFGLYNEKLDAVPTYMGIEPPELFDKDHLMLTRTTNLMLRGSVLFDDHSISYALTTGNDERGGDGVPIGGDLRYQYSNILTLGTSFYMSGEGAQASRGVGEGSPTGGVATWMAEDNYSVFGGFLELKHSGVHLQAEFWTSPHDAKRDPDQVNAINRDKLNARQIERFWDDAGQVIEDVEYSVMTYYVRVGYTLETDWGDLVPYAQYDFYQNEETIASKGDGGDNEAGLSDDGKFIKATAGVVYRPVPELALKVDGSTHTQQYNGESITYPEVRVSLSYLWTLF